MTLGSRLSRFGGHRFAVRYSDGSLERARAVVVAGEADRESGQPYGVAFSDDDQIRPGVAVKPAEGGSCGRRCDGASRKASRAALGGRVRPTAAAPTAWIRPLSISSRSTGSGRPSTCSGDLRLPTFSSGEILASLALHAFVATGQPESPSTLEAPPGGPQRATAVSRTPRTTSGGWSELSPLNDVWYQCRWPRPRRRPRGQRGRAGLPVGLLPGDRSPRGERPRRPPSLGCPATRSGRATS